MYGTLNVADKFNYCNELHYSVTSVGSEILFYELTRLKVGTELVLTFF